MHCRLSQCYFKLSFHTEKLNPENLTNLVGSHGQGAGIWICSHRAHRYLHLRYPSIPGSDSLRRTACAPREQSMGANPSANIFCMAYELPLWGKAFQNCMCINAIMSSAGFLCKINKVLAATLTCLCTENYMCKRLSFLPEGPLVRGKHKLPGSLLGSSHFC